MGARPGAGRPPAHRDAPARVPSPTCVRRRAGPLARAGRGGPPAVGPGAAVRHDRQRPAGGRGPDPRRAPGRDRRPVGAVRRRVGRPIPDAAFGGTVDADVARPRPSPDNRPAGLPVQQVALDPVDGQPGRRTGAVLGRGRPAGRGARRTGGCSPGWAWSRATPCRCCAGGRIGGWPAMEVLGRDGGRLARAAAWPRSRSSRSTAASRRRSGSSSGRSACRRPGTPTVTGGMAFAGGPFNNFVLQSMAAVVPRSAGRPRPRSAWSPRSAGC